MNCFPCGWKSVAKDFDLVSQRCSALMFSTPTWICFRCALVFGLIFISIFNTDGLNNFIHTLRFWDDGCGLGGRTIKICSVFNLSWGFRELSKRLARNRHEDSRFICARPQSISCSWCLFLLFILRIFTILQHHHGRKPHSFDINIYCLCSFLNCPRVVAVSNDPAHHAPWAAVASRCHPTFCSRIFLMRLSIQIFGTRLTWHNRRSLGEYENTQPQPIHNATKTEKTQLVRCQREKYSGDIPTPY